MKAVELLIYSGDFENLLHLIDNLLYLFINRGPLKTVVDQLKTIASRSTAPQTRIDAALDVVRSDLLLFTGEWTLALEYHQRILEDLRKTSNIYSRRNINFVTTCLELNRFMGEIDLSEAETTLLEYIQKNRMDIKPLFLLVVVYSYQGRLEEAHEKLNQGIKYLNKPISKQTEASKLQAEAELARAGGIWGEAISKYKTRIDIFESGGYRWQWARELIDLGDSLVGRGLPGDREQAMQVYRQSLEMFTEMGAPGYIQVLEERLGRM
jgi:tetratricopeptide (TPR) repeat protein